MNDRIKLIKHIIEPAKLFLVWQPHESVSPSRTRRVVGQLTREDSGRITFNYLHGEDLDIAINEGFIGYGLFNDYKQIYTENVMDEFIRRLPPRKRKDFNHYLLSLRIPPKTEISDFALLGYSGATLPSDSFSILNTFEGVEGGCQFLHEIAGFRYHMKTEGMISKEKTSGNIFLHIGIGDKVDLVPEPDNEYDSRAIRIDHNGRKLGYINRLMTSAFHRWITTKSVTATIEKVLGRIERPRVFLFVDVS